MRSRPLPFTKRRPDAPDGFFAAEAAGLRWLGEVTPAGGAPAAQVLEVGSHHIEVERLYVASPTREAAADFGHRLALTHAAGADAFGAPPAGWTGAGFIGRQAMTMRPDHSWGRFYAEQRMLPYARRAVEVGHLSHSGLQAVERVADRLLAGDFDDDRPAARIHGDLWAGNVVFTDTGVVMIDPAAHGGHGLTDLAMLHLFGAPHLDAITGANAEGAKLTPEWRDLIGLHQLHPLLVHAASHGPSYGREAEAVAQRYL